MKLFIEIEVRDDWEHCLDMQPQIQKALDEDRWSWCIAVPPAQPSAKPLTDELGPLLEDALAAYWDAAYAEGREGREHDTPDGAAQTALLRVREAARTLKTLAQPPAEPVAAKWQPMETAPKDGTDVLLLIEGGEHPLEDASQSRTIGTFGVEGGPAEDLTWTFAGWSWEQDCYCKGTGTPIGWMPLPATSAP